MKITEFEETIKKFSEIQSYAPFVTFFFLNGSHLTLRTFKQYVVKHLSGNENVVIFSFGINRGGVERENVAISINAVKATFSRSTTPPTSINGILSTMLEKLSNV